MLVSVIFTEHMLKFISIFIAINGHDITIITSQQTHTCTSEYTKTIHLILDVWLDVYTTSEHKIIEWLQ